MSDLNSRKLALQSRTNRASYSDKETVTITVLKNSAAISNGWNQSPLAPLWPGQSAHSGYNHTTRRLGHWQPRAQHRNGTASGTRGGTTLRYLAAEHAHQTSLALSPSHHTCTYIPQQRRPTHRGQPHNAINPESLATNQDTSAVCFDPT